MKISGVLSKKHFSFQEVRMIRRIITEKVEMEKEMDYHADEHQDYPEITTMVRTLWSLQYFT